MIYVLYSIRIWLNPNQKTTHQYSDEDVKVIVLLIEKKRKSPRSLAFVYRPVFPTPIWRRRWHNTAAGQSSQRDVHVCMSRLDSAPALRDWSLGERAPGPPLSAPKWSRKDNGMESNEGLVMSEETATVWLSTLRSSCVPYTSPPQPPPLLLLLHLLLHRLVTRAWPDMKGSFFAHFSSLCRSILQLFCRNVKILLWAVWNSYHSLRMDAFFHVNGQIIGWADSNHNCFMTILNVLVMIIPCLSLHFYLHVYPLLFDL